MRILFVNPYYKPYLGGIERIIERLCVEFRKSSEVEAVGVLTTRVYFPDRVMSGLPSHEVIDGVDVFRCTLRPAALPPIFHASRAGYVSLDLPRVLRRFRPDIIHFTYSEWWAANLGIYLLTPKTRHVLSTFFHEVPRMKRTLPLYKVNGWLAPRMSAVHVLSEVEKQQVHTAYNAPLRRTVVIPPGVDVPGSVPERVERAGVTVLAVGRLAENKGQMALVRMVGRLIREHPGLDPRLWLAGDDAGMAQPISEYVAAHGLGGVVRLFGKCSDEQLDELYRDADIFALPTMIESFGLVFIEAMAHGLPVVTYGTGPIPSILKRGALLVSTGDEDAFYDALRSLALDSPGRIELGLEGREMVSRQYSWEATGDQFLGLYRHLLRKPSNASEK